MMSRRLGAFLAIVVCLFWSPASATDTASTCGPEPNKFVAKRTPVNAAHAEILNLIAKGSPDKEAVSKRLPKMQAAVRAEKLTRDQELLVRFDLANINAMVAETSDRKLNEALQAARNDLRKHAKGVEALSVLAERDLNRQSTDIKEITRARQFLTYLSTLVDDPGEIWPLFRIAGENTDGYRNLDPEVRAEWRKTAEHAAALYREHRSPRVRAESHLAVASFVSMNSDASTVERLQNELRQHFDEVERLAKLDTVIDERGRKEDDCRHISLKAVETALSVFSKSADDAERRRAIEFGIPHAANDGMLETDYIGAISNVAPIFRVRNSYPDIYRKAMNIIDPLVCGEGIQRSYCVEHILVDAFSQLQVFTLARELQSSYLKAVRSHSRDPMVLGEALVRQAELEWSYGSASRAETVFTEASSIEDISLQTRVSMLLLGMKIADAKLDDEAVVEAARRLIALYETVALQDNAEIRSNIQQALDEAVWFYWRGKFCSGCGEEMDAVAKSWFRQRAAEFGKLNEMDATDYWPVLMLPYLDKHFMTPQDRNTIVDAALALTRENSVRVANPSISVDIERSARLFAPKKMKSDQTARAISIVNHFRINDSYDDFSVAFFKFLFHKDYNLQKKLWKDYSDYWFDSDFNQWGMDTKYLQTLENGARLLSAHGFDTAARIVWQDMLQRMEPRDPANPSQVSITDRAKLALIGLAAPAHAREAAYALAEEDFEQANRHLDAMRRLVEDRFTAEWRAGSERTVFLFRELSGALRLAAQTRLKLATNPKVLRLLPDLPEQAYRDLQLAMLGDTGLTLQSAHRRRILSDPSLEAALTRRDEASALLELHEAHETVIEAADEFWAEKERQSLQDRRREAEEQVARLLTTSGDITAFSPVSIGETREVLRHGEGFLSLHVGSDAVYGLYFGNGTGSPMIWRSPIRAAELDRQIATLRQGVMIEGGRPPPFPLEKAHDLANLLLGPVKAHLKEVDRLIIATDGPLQSLSFAILPLDVTGSPSAGPSGSLHRGIEWLGVSHAITYTPSAQTLVATRRSPVASAASEPFFGFGDPLIGSARKEAQMQVAFNTLLWPSTTRGGIKVTELANLPALPDTAIELRRMAKALGSGDDVIRLGEHASETLLRQTDLSRYRVVAFATHAMVARELSGHVEPGLVLTPLDTPSENDDGYLSLSEILSLKLDADLVVLSACNTAASDGRPRAEGFSGLTRGFLSVGARALLVSHWSVPSAETSELMSRLFAAHAHEGAPSWSVALRDSIRSMVNDPDQPTYSHPANWGAFVVVGDDARRR